MKLIDDAKNWWRMTSVQVQIVWGVACQVYATLPFEKQVGVLNSIGLNGEAMAYGISFMAQVAAGVAAATVVARVTAQPSLRPPQE